jgi:hypothetical protein
MQDTHEGLNIVPGIIRIYGYVKTEGSGNLLICKKGAGPYKIVGACIDETMASFDSLAPNFENANLSLSTLLSREHEVAIR